MNMAEEIVSSKYVCADCGENMVAFVDMFYNVGICECCSEVHKQLKTTSEHIQPISEETTPSIQNERVNKDLELFLPSIPIKQGRGMHAAIRKRFIFEKYNNKTFSIEEQYNSSQSSKGEMSGHLLKKGKNGEKWKYRFFILKNGRLDYFIDNQSAPKSSLDVNKLSIIIQTLENDSFQMAINYISDSSTSRTYYLTFTAVNELYNWYLAILTAQTFASKRVYTESSTQILSGYLYKVGTGKFNRWKKRWVTLNKGHLMYFVDKQSPYPKGEFDILTKKHGYDILVGDVGHRVSAPSSHTFRIITPTRIYKFCAETEFQLNEWTEVIGQVLLD